MHDYLKGFLYDAGERFVPFRAWLGDLKDPKILRADIIAGITVALVLVPQAMAYAQLAGLPPYIGLYASFLVPIVAAIFGSSRQLQNGPVAIISLMTAAALAPIGLPAEQLVIYAALLAIMAGLMQIALGFLRLGVLVDFLSHPVVIGFSNAAAIVIASLQLDKLFGIDNPRTDHLYDSLINLAKAIPTETHMPTLAMGLFTLALLVGFKKFAPKLPGMIFAMVIATLASWALGYEGMGGRVVGDIPKGLPSFSIPDFDVKYIPSLMVPALLIALLSFVEAFSIAKAVASRTRQRISADQEMVGKGLANLTAGFMSGYPVSGSFSRTAVAFEAGAVTGFAAIVSGILVGLTLVFFTPLLYPLPIASLAAVIIMSVIGLFQPKQMLHTWTVTKHDGIVAFTVFFATLWFAPHLEKGIFIGVAMSLLFYIYYTMRPHFAEVALYHDGSYRDADMFDLQTSDTLAVYRYDGDLYFANSSYVEKRILNSIAGKPKLKVVMLDLEAVAHIDATGEEMLSHLSERIKTAGIAFYVTRAKFMVTDVLKRSGLYDKIGEDHFFSKRITAIQSLKEKYGDDIDITPFIINMPLEKDEEEQSAEADKTEAEAKDSKGSDGKGETS